MLEDLIKLVSAHKLSLTNEKDCQKDIESVLIQNNISYQREFRLNKKDIPDFYLPDQDAIIEVKIKGKSFEIYRQCLRYCQSNLFTNLILMTNKSMGLPDKINNKPSYLINIGKAWL